MKGKIDKDGILFVERAGEMKEQVCPYASRYAGLASCGDWCPLFQEPYLYTEEESHLVYTVVEICRRSIFFKQFEDERVKP